MRRLVALMVVGIVLICATGCTVLMPGAMGARVLDEADKAAAKPGVKSVEYRHWTLLGLFESYRISIENDK